MSGGKSRGGGTTVQKTEPWEGQKPYLRRGFERAEQLYQTGKPNFYPGQTIADINPLQVAAQNQALANLTSGPGAAVINSAQAGQALLTSPMMLSPASNPYLQAWGQSLADTIGQQYAERVFPAMADRAAAMGAYGGYRAGVAEAQAAQRMGQEIGRALTPLYAQGYSQGLQAMARGLAFAPQTIQLSLMPAQMAEQIGATRRQWEQQFIDADRERWEFEQMKDWYRLQNYMDIVGGGTYGGVASTTGPGRSPLMGALGGASMGLGLWAGAKSMGLLGGALASNPVGWGIAAIGALAGLFG